MFAAYYIYRNPNDIFIPVIEVNWTKNRYIMQRGTEVKYYSYKLPEFIQRAYLELKRLGITHDDILLQNIVNIGEYDYRLIDFESMRKSKSNFKDFCLCNRLLNRISRNAGATLRTGLS